MPPPATQLIPGLYPLITKVKPRIGGRNNLGVGVDTTGAEYVLKTGRAVCVAEFVGAAVCAALEVPHCRTAIVTMRMLNGSTQHLFGSVIEDQLHKFDTTDVDAWRDVVSKLHDPLMFTVMLAIDLCLGNDDRHQDNWILKHKHPTTGADCYKLLAMDFSNAWPTIHPPHHPCRHPSTNTWTLPRHWDQMGIAFDRALFLRSCAKIAALRTDWLHSVLDPLVNIWLTQQERDALCQWWSNHWMTQAIDTIYSLEPDGEWL